MKNTGEIRREKYHAVTQLSGSDKPICRSNNGTGNILKFEEVS
jgi:hypothetical protein